MKKQATSVRWIILALLAGFSFVSYVQRVNISIAAELMMPDLSLTKVQMGQVFGSFLLGYALFQLPAGILGDGLGSRIVLSTAAFSWGVCTMLSGLIPGTAVRTPAGIFVSLLALRFLLGLGEAATYPVATRAVGIWMPPAQQAFGNSLVLAGMPLASTVTPPLVSWLMVKTGWRESFWITSASAFLIAVLWMWYAKDSPELHPDVNREELALIAEGRSEKATEKGESATLRSLLTKKNVFLLTVSYFCEGYVLFTFVFWLYIYLVEVRRFSILHGGFVASLPWITSLVLQPLGGLLCDRLSVRRGRLAGGRITIMVGYGLAGSLLFLATGTSDRAVAVALLCLSVGSLLAAEPSFWSSAIHLAPKHIGAVSGTMNTAGVLGGVLSTALIPILIKYLGWVAALGSAAAIAVLCALFWFGIRREMATSKQETRRRLT